VAFFSLSPSWLHQSLHPPGEWEVFPIIRPLDWTAAKHQALLVGCMTRRYSATASIYVDFLAVQQ
jgi:hypothetical protein